MANQKSVTTTWSGNELFDYLQAIPDPKPMGPRHQPVPHRDLLYLLLESLDFHGYKVDLSGIRGTLVGDPAEDPNADLFLKAPIHARETLLPGRLDSRLEIGLRHSNRERFAVKITAGYRILVCSNGVMTGENLLRKKHTTGTVWKWEIDAALERLQEERMDLTSTMSRIARLRLVPGTDEVDAISWRLLTEDHMPRPIVTQARALFQEGALPELQEMRDTLGGFFQSLTRAVALRDEAKPMPVHIREDLETRAFRRVRAEARYLVPA